MRNDAANQSAPRGIDLENWTKCIISSVRFWHVAYSTHFENPPDYPWDDTYGRGGNWWCLKKQLLTRPWISSMDKITSSWFYKAGYITFVHRVSSRKHLGRGQGSLDKDNRYSGYQTHQTVRSGLRKIGGGYPTDNRSLNL